jgi:hypothetical protein
MIPYADQIVPSPLRDWVIIQKSAEFLVVMPDLIRHPVSEQSEKALDSGSSPE